MSYTDAPAPDELTARIDRLEHEIAKLRSERETALTGWPSTPTIAQGFMSGRWQRRDGADYPTLSIPEAPADQNYYGRYQGTWQPVVEEAPGLTARRSTYGWARASAGSDVTWLNLDDILANFQPAGDYAPAGDYLAKSGGQMAGPLITRDGGSATNPGIAIGENTTGFYRTAGNLLVTTVSGQIVTQIQPTLAAFFLPVNLTGQRLQAVGDATAADDALNLRTADGRYLSQPAADVRYLQIAVGGIIQGPLQLYATPIVSNDVVTKGYTDQSIAAARVPAFVYDLPADVLIPGDGAWHQLAVVPFTLARTGLSRLQVTLNCNMSGVDNVACVGARLAAGGAERRLFGFGIMPGGASVGFSCNLYFDTAPGAISIPIEVASIGLAQSPPSFTVLGGSGPEHSQIAIIDLGPV
jgi:hypothetical protein